MRQASCLGLRPSPSWVQGAAPRDSGFHWCSMRSYCLNLIKGPRTAARIASADLLQKANARPLGGPAATRRPNPQSALIAPLVASRYGAFIWAKRGGVESGAKKVVLSVQSQLSCCPPTPNRPTRPIKRSRATLILEQALARRPSLRLPRPLLSLAGGSKINKASAQNKPPVPNLACATMPAQSSISGLVKIRSKAAQSVS